MKISKKWVMTCRGCGEKVEVFEYEGLEGGRYGSHHCKEISDLLIKHPRLQNRFKEPMKTLD